MILSLVLFACEGPAGPQGPAGATGDAGSQGSTGATGDGGEQGSAGVGPWLTQPGVAIAVTDLAFHSNAATVSFTITDGSGAALDSQRPPHRRQGLDQLRARAARDRTRWLARAIHRLHDATGDEWLGRDGHASTDRVERPARRRRRRQRRVHVHVRCAAHRDQHDAHADGRRPCRANAERRQRGDRQRDVFGAPGWRRRDRTRGSDRHDVQRLPQGAVDARRPMDVARSMHPVPPAAVE